MPGSPKGPKGKKLTKAEKERLKKEEDEKKAKEEGGCEDDEEEARLKAERDAQEQKEREQNEAEERRRLENERGTSTSGSTTKEKERSSSAKSAKSGKGSPSTSDGKSTPLRKRSGSRSSSSKSSTSRMNATPTKRSDSTCSSRKSSASSKSEKEKHGSGRGTRTDEKQPDTENGQVESTEDQQEKEPEQSSKKEVESNECPEDQEESCKGPKDCVELSDHKEEKVQSTESPKETCEGKKDKVEYGGDQNEKLEGGGKIGETKTEVADKAPSTQKDQDRPPSKVPRESAASTGRRVSIAPRGSSRRSIAVPLDNQRKSMATPREETQMAIAREEAMAAKAAAELEAKRKAEYEKELERLLERMGTRWVGKYNISKERKRRKGQLLELDQIWEANRSTLKLEHAERRKAAKWDRYMKCDGSPDPTIQGEINTYMNLWKEDMNSNDIANVLKESKLTLSLIDELNFLSEDTPPEELSPEILARYKATVDELQAMLHKKLELASHDMLMKATENADSETSNLQQVITNDVITLCMWGNLSKNPRIKQFEFEKKGFTFEIPKVLCLSDCAIRVLFTKFDHLSPQCRTYLSRQKHKVEEETPGEKPEEEGEKEGAKEGEEGQEGPKEGEEGAEGEEAPKEEAEIEREDSEENSMSQMETLPSEGESSHSALSEYTSNTPDTRPSSDRGSASGSASGSQSASSTRYSGSAASKDNGESEAEKPPEKIKNFFDVLAALKELDGDGEKTDEQKVEEELEEEYDIKTPEPVEWEDFDGDEDAVDLRANHIMGGIFHFNLLNMPPQPKQVRDWVIVQVHEPPALSYMEYVADGAPAPPSSAKPKEEKGKETPQAEEEGKKREERPPITVTQRLPEDVYFCEEPQVVRWNDESKEWRLDGFSDHTFNEENRILTFKTNYFGTMALIQDAHINMPFQSWEIRPHKTNSAVLTVIAAIVEVEIEIKDGLCSLNIPEDRHELEHMRDQWLQPGEFIKRMRAAGMNIFPAEDSSKYVSVQNKNSVTEDRLYQQMALTASSMAYSWSKWNSEVKDDAKVVIQGTEHLEDEPLLEVGMPRRRRARKKQPVYSLTKMEDWSLFLVTKKRVTKLKMTEFDENFSEDHAEGTEFHADLYHMATEIMSEPGKERVTDTSQAFTDCVYQLLSATKIVTYS